MSPLQRERLALPAAGGGRRRLRFVAVRPAYGESIHTQGAVLVVHAPASGEPLDQIQTKAARPVTGGAAADRAVTTIRDFHPNDAVDGGCPEVQRRTGGLIGVPDAVGDEL